MAEVDKYKCEACGGSGYKDGANHEGKMCQPCHGTGRKQITITLEEYDRLTLAEKQRDKAIELMHQKAINTTCSICHEFLKKAILSYREGEK